MASISDERSCDLHNETFHWTFASACCIGSAISSLVSSGNVHWDFYVFEMVSYAIVITVNGRTPAWYDIPCTGRVPSANWFSLDYVSLKFEINEVKQLNFVLYSTKYYNLSQINTSDWLSWLLMRHAHAEVYLQQNVFPYVSHLNAWPVCCFRLCLVMLAPQKDTNFVWTGFFSVGTQ